MDIRFLAREQARQARAMREIIEGETPVFVLGFLAGFAAAQAETAPLVDQAHKEAHGLVARLGEREGDKP